MISLSGIFSGTTSAEFTSDGEISDESSRNPLSKAIFDLSSNTFCPDGYDSCNSVSQGFAIGSFETVVAVIQDVIGSDADKPFPLVDYKGETVVAGEKLLVETCKDEDGDVTDMVMYLKNTVTDDVTAIFSPKYGAVYIVDEDGDNDAFANNMFCGYTYGDWISSWNFV